MTAFRSLDDILKYTDTLAWEDQARIALHIRNMLNRHLTEKQLKRFGVAYPYLDPDAAAEDTYP